MLPASDQPQPPAQPRPTPQPRARLRLQSISWALLAGGAAAALGLGGGLEPALRAGGCGFFYGLLAFHLQRVDPDDGHLQAGLVGAVCGLLSLGAALDLPPFGPLAWGQGLAPGLSSLMMALIRAWLPLWLPVAGAALLLQGAQRLLPALRP
nr:hypothetical protein [Synechococcus sp. CS-1333]